LHLREACSLYSLTIHHCPFTKKDHLLPDDPYYFN
jgi:hypothetical protein